MRLTAVLNNQVSDTNISHHPFPALSAGEGGLQPASGAAGGTVLYVSVEFVCYLFVYSISVAVVDYCRALLLYKPPGNEEASRSLLAYSTHRDLASPVGREENTARHTA